DVSHRGNYYHEYCMAISVRRESLNYQDMTADAEDTVIEALRDLARWLYRRLENEYNALTSDEMVDETIVANAYTFTASGRRFG
ncbi:MAG: antitoxin of toxin-antitoxin stability system, partial [Rhizobiales bacterium]|nr:antitoxin of toxin-antitoxin stability system [Hyphomicrobiales bacterium]